MQSTAANAREQFLKRVAVRGPDDCWLWTGGFSSNGRPAILCDGKMQVASRVAYQLFVGPIPPRKLVCHKCDVKACVNPNHLWIGTHADNQHDAMKKGRSVAPPSRAKVSKQQVKAIRDARDNGESIKSLAARYGLHRNTISVLTLGKSHTKL